MNQRFIQLHFLTSYPAALLNRDDIGFAKRIPFGGSTRTRISSQCLKRHWRKFEGEAAIRNAGVEMSIRSRVTFERHIFQALLDEGIEESLARGTTEAIMAEVLGESARAKKEKGQSEGVGEATRLRTGQITILGRPEVEFLLGEAREVCKAKPKDAKAIRNKVSERFSGEAKQNLKALKHAAGLDAALFGRMVTSDMLARGDAAVHVAHAFTVHEEESESDYFSAVDDLLAEGEEQEKGSGHIGNIELTSGLYYGYVVVDVPLLVSNLEGCAREDWEEADRKLAGNLVGRLIHVVAKVSPGAKLGSTAPHSWAQCVLVESGNSQPRTLANAFLRPVPLRPDVLRNTYEALRAHLVDLDSMYGANGERRLAGIGSVELLKDVCGLAQPLDAVADWARARVRGTG